MKPLVILLCCLFSMSMFGQDLNSALKLISSEQYEEAEKILDDLIKKTPTNGDLYYYYGDALLKDYLSDTLSNSMDEFVKKAEAIFQEGIKQAPTNVLNEVGMGAVTLLRSSDTLKADPYFARAELVVPAKMKKKDFSPEKAVILTKLGAAQLYGRVNRFRKAIAYLNQAKLVNPNDPNVYLTLGDVYSKMNDASNALLNYNQALNKDPKSPAPKIKIGNIYMRVPNLTAARPYFEEAQQIDSTFAPVYRSLGELWSLAGRYDLAKKYYYTFMQLSGNTTPAKIRYANSLFRAKDYNGAISVIEEILSVDNSRNYLNRLAAYSCYEKKPQDLEKAKNYMDTFFKNAKEEDIISRDYAYNGRILYKMAKGDSAKLDVAFDQLKKALAMNPGDPALISEMASDYYYARRYKEALEMYDMKAKNGGLGRSDAMMIAKSYYSLGDNQNAYKAFGDIAVNDPKNSIDAYLYMARTSSNTDPDLVQGTAAADFQTLIDKIGTETDKYKTQLAEAYSYFGYYNLNKKEYDTAKEWYKKLLNLDPKNKDQQIKALSSLGVIAYKEKKYTEALEAYQQLLALDPNNADFKQAIVDLNKTIKASQK